MRPTDILREEHELVLLMLKIMSAVCDRIDRGENVDSARLGNIVDFIKNFADACHHAKEEKLFFPAIAKLGTAWEEGPISVMLHEHTLAREFTKGMDAAVKKLLSGYKGADKFYVENARRYVDLLTAHIAKENDVLFALADQRLNQNEEKSLMEGFDRIEREETGEGVHEKYHHMLHELRDIFLK